MKKYILYTIAIISILFLIRCEKDENPELLKTVFTNKVPKLATMPLSEITDTSAFSGGIINNDGGSKIIANGVCWSISPNPTINDNKTVDSIGNKNFTSKLTNLKAFTLYHIRSYATNNTGTAYGNTLLLKTSSNIPQINTQSISQITDSSVICGGDISSDGGAEINARGVCWSTSQNPTINNSKTLDSIGIGSFISNPIGLNAITTYYIRAYATNGVGTAYGEEKTFTTITAIPKLTTDSITSLTATSAVSGGYIKSTGGMPITAKGVCWSTSPNPTINDNKTENGTGPSAFTSNITGLNPGTFYYIRAYASNSLGTAYGDEESFITLQPTVPVLTTNNISSITNTSAVSGGNILSDVGYPVVSRGVCWSTTPSPTVALITKTTDGVGIGSFTSNITGLLAGTTYFVRAYATNSVGTAYGNQVSFTTSSIVFDIDGNAYDTIQIGTQIWLKQNLKTTKYRNGTVILNVTDNAVWAALSSGAYCDYNNTPANSTTYGRLYNWYVVNTGNLCPTGWHVPTDAEWTTLTTYLGGESIAGGKLKEIGLAHWNSPNTAATNISGFTALPGGYRNNDGEYYFIGMCGYWWSSNEINTTLAWLRFMSYSDSNVYRHNSGKSYGYSVRCLKN